MRRHTPSTIGPWRRTEGLERRLIAAGAVTLQQLAVGDAATVARRRPARAPGAADPQVPDDPVE